MPKLADGLSGILQEVTLIRYTISTLQNSSSLPKDDYLALVLAIFSCNIQYQKMNSEYSILV